MDTRVALLVFARGFPEFANLKHLELLLRLEAQDKHSILFLTSLIEVTRLGFSCGRDVLEMWRRVSQRKPISKAGIRHLMKSIDFLMSLGLSSGDRFIVARNFPLGSRHHCVYKCLKAVDFGGFSGHPAELELAIYLLENSLMLERITIDPHSSKVPKSFLDSETLELARAQPKQLETKLPSGAKLSIL